MKNKYIKLLGIVFCLSLLLLGGIFVFIKKEGTTKNFSLQLIKKVNEDNNHKNIVISPYSIEVALSMLRDGGVGNTKSQIDKVIMNRELQFPEGIRMANALFIKNKYKDVVEDEYSNHLNDDYQAEILYDEFKSPKVINDWVSDKTNKMIPNFMDSIGNRFVLGLVNAVAMDAEWKYPFECNETLEKDFNNGKDKSSVMMMHNTYSDEDKGVQYLDNKDVKGILLPYKDELEFVALRPKKDIDTFIKKLNDRSFIYYLEQFKDIESDVRVSLNLPKFEYDYDLKNFKNILIDFGITDAFNADKANFNTIIKKENLSKVDPTVTNIYVDSAIHKAKISLAEKKTKAAAATGFMLFETSAVPSTDNKLIEINFDKPFMYLIRDSKTKEIYFIGVVYQPSTGESNICE